MSNEIRTELSMQLKKILWKRSSSFWGISNFSFLFSFFFWSHENDFVSYSPTIHKRKLVDSSTSLVETKSQLVSACSNQRSDLFKISGGTCRALSERLARDFAFYEPTRPRPCWRENRRFERVRSSNYPVYSIYITHTRYPLLSTPSRSPTSFPSRCPLCYPRRRPHGNRSNYRRVSGSTNWIQKLCRWCNNIRHTFARVNIELSSLVIPR